LIAIGETDIDSQERSIGASTDIGSDEYNPFRVIESITKETNNNIKIDWNTVSGIDEYRIYSSTDEYGEEMTWELEYTWTTGTTEWTDSIDCESIDFKYYKVAYTTTLGAVIESDAVGFYNVTVTKGAGAQNMISCPFWIANNTLGGILGDQIKENLTSQDGAFVKKRAYENQQWESSILSGTPPQWANGDIKMAPTESFDLFFIYGSGSTAKITFLGYVPQQMGNALIFGDNTSSTYETGFAYPFPVNTTLNDIPFILYGFTGSTSSVGADKIVSPSSTYSDTWTTVMWLRSDGKWRVGNDQDPTESQLEVKPCKGFYLQKTNNERKALTIKKPYEK
jgi:hypothetical protein